MKNYIQSGNMVTITAPTGGVTSGQGVLIGNLFGIAANTATEGESVELATTGVYDLPKAANAVLAAGARVSWNAATSQIVAPATGMIPIGVALTSAANGTTSVHVRLDGTSTAAA